jgi:signal transduction histidine kinase
MIDTIWGIEKWFLPLLYLITLLGGFAITTRAFLPVEKISMATNHIISGKDLTKRIDIGEGKDEIHLLADTINNMLDRLETSFETEKQFTSDASHELRTPLSVIKAHTEFALEFAESEEDYKEALEVINRQGDKMSALLSQLLFFTRLEQSNRKVELKEGNLSNLVQSIFDDRYLVLQGKREFVGSIEDGITARYDESLLSRLIDNLLDNAEKYSEVGSTIKIKLWDTETAIKLSVEDSGKGILPENLDKIWNRFFREDESRSEEYGTSFGLGLSMVKEIASIHNGTIDVDSQINVGSTFTLTLPK